VCVCCVQLKRFLIGSSFVVDWSSNDGFCAGDTGLDGVSRPTFILPFAAFISFSRLTFSSSDRYYLCIIFFRLPKVKAVSITL